MKVYFFIIFNFIIFYYSVAQNSNPKEFRGMWITTVKMIDYPSKRGLSGDNLKNELIAILDSCKALGINAIVFQIRPAADAFYNSPYEPWSEWLTGQQGRAPNPYFDPLEFLIVETHKRNMEFHAWINPFRAVATVSHAHICEAHITRQKPEWFFTYDINKYFNPGIPAVQDYLLKIICDIVKRYNIDGIHFDDYFYPYPVRDSENKIIPIPDYYTFEKYGKKFSDIGDWRRDNINKFVQRVHDSIKSIKPDVKFGISPPGVWRNKGNDPKGSETLGLAAYDWIYADVLWWLKNKWVDYIAPQLYWNIGHKRANFSVLIDWWSKNAYGVDLYVGLFIHGIDATRQDPNWGNPNQIPNQMKLARSYPAVKGFIFYRYKSFKDNPLGIKNYLKKDFKSIEKNPNNNNFELIYIPKFAEKNDNSNKIIDIEPPSTPVNLDFYRIENEITLTWENSDILEEFYDKPSYYNIYVFKGKKIGNLEDKTHIFNTSNENFFKFKREKKVQIFGKYYTFAITAIDSVGNESLPSNTIKLKL